MACKDFAEFTFAIILVAIAYVNQIMSKREAVIRAEIKKEMAQHNAVCHPQPQPKPGDRTA